MRDRLRLVLRLARKDWRVVWPWAVLAWLATGSRWAAVLARGRVSEVVDMFALASALIPFLALARLVHVDPVPGTTQFWVTRPIPPGALLTVKLLLAFVAVVLPCVLVEVAPLTATGLRLDAEDYVLVFALTLLWYLAAVGLALLSAAFTGTVSSALLLGLSALMLVSVGMSYVRRLWPTSFEFNVTLVSGRIVGGLLTAAACPVVLWVLYRTRSRRRAALLLAALGALLFAVDRWWAWNWISAPLRPAAAPAHGHDWRHVNVRLDPRRKGEGASSSSQRSRVSLGVIVENLPDCLSLVQTGYAARATVSGRDESLQVDLRHPPRRGLPVDSSYWVPSRLEQALTGCAPGNQGGRVEVFAPRTGEYDARSGGWKHPNRVREVQRAEGTLFFAVARPYVVARAPLRAGSVLESHGWRRTVLAIPSAASPELRVRTEQVVVPYLEYSRFGLWSAVFDPAEGKFYRAASSGRIDSSASGGLAYRVWETAERGWQGKGNETLTTLPDATEMALLAAEPLGTLQVPFVARLPESW